MEPLSLATRRWYAIISSVMFVAVLGVAALYASGYNVNVKKLSVVETGGVHVAVPAIDAVVTLNGKEVGKSSLLTHSFFLDNLAPGTYAVTVVADGYYPWTKNLVVLPKLVTEANAFMVPTDLTLVSAIAPATKVATTTEVSGGLLLTVADGAVTLTWTRDLAEAPEAFCLAPHSCIAEVPVAPADIKATDARFFENGVVYRTAKGIYFAEADIKRPRVLVPLYQKPGATFRVDKKRLYISDGAVTYEVTGF